MVKVRELEWRGAGDRIEAWFNNPGTARPVHCIPAKETDTDLVLAQGIKEAADRIDALEKALRWQADVIRKNLSENGLDKHRLFLDGTYHEGPVVDWVHEVLTGFENINRAALGEGE